MTSEQRLPSLPLKQIDMTIRFKPIGFVETESGAVPRHWTVSEAKGRLVIDEQYRQGLADIEVGQQIVVLFHFDSSPPFNSSYLMQTPPSRNTHMGVFSTCSPIRPNAIGLSVVKVLQATGNVLHVQGLDMLDGTPILDIKPHVAAS